MTSKQDFKSGKWPFGAVGEPDDVPIPEGAGCVKIDEIIARADEYAGEYSFGGRADTLPTAPGIYVDEVPVLLPLDEAQAQKMIDKCEKSPFGHNMETKTDESVRKSWQLEPDQVKIKNPLWQTGVDKLTETIAGRLGYKGIPLQCKLYKLLVYGEGGHFLKHQDTEKEDGMIATLVVQPPSTHEGGDLVVYRNGEVEHRHDFGKNDATAPYFCHYAVHYADAEHALEKVTKGYRLALVYSICLPSSMRHLQRDSGRMLSDELVDVISTMGPGNESFALLLSHQYTMKSIGDLGFGALKGVDSARFRVLEGANAAVVEGKRLRFFIAELSVAFETRLEEDGWRLRFYTEGLHWYTASGEGLGYWETRGVKLNFLNPGRETLTQLWKAYREAEDVYTGNEGTAINTKYARFAVVAWPASRHLDCVLKLMSAELAVEELLARRPVDVLTLRSFLDAAVARYGWGPKTYGSTKTSLRFSRGFCELLADAGDVDLVKLFVTTYCPRLGNMNDNNTIVPVMVKVINAFPWGEIGSAMLDVLGNWTQLYQTFVTSRDSEMELLLQVGDAVEEHEAKRDLFAMAAKCNMRLRTPKTVQIFWENVLLPADSQSFKAMADSILQKNPSELGPFVEVFSKHVGEYDTSSKFAAIEAIAAKRMGWLKGEIERLDKVDKAFSWKMPYASYPEYSEVEEFFQGTEQSMTTEGVVKLTDIYHANSFAEELNHSLYEGSYTVETGENREPFVKITKTREWFDSVQNRLVQYGEELAHLKERYASAASEVSVPE